jgi:hypothetical protein
MAAALELSMATEKIAGREIKSHSAVGVLLQTFGLINRYACTLRWRPQGPRKPPFRPSRVESD